MAAIATTTPVGSELLSGAHVLGGGSSPSSHAAPKRSVVVPSSTTTAPGSSSTSHGSTSGSASTAGLKAPLVGLLDRHHAPTSQFKNVVKGFVVNTSWAALQPVKNGPIVHPNAIDNAIKVAQAEGLGIKLRIQAGLEAPEWAKTLSGAPVPFHYTVATRGMAGKYAGTVGRFWEPAFASAYAQLQQKLAAAYDNVPQIRQTDITQCQTIFSETYLRDTMNKANAQALLAAGYSIAADQQCHNAQIAAAKYWVHTRSDLTFNPYTAIYPNGQVKQDMPYTLSQMVYCRSVLGARCVLENHSLSTSRDSHNANYQAIYSEMQKLDGGGPFDFQTATMGKIGSLTSVIDWAGEHGATSVELPTGYQSMSVAALGAIDLKF